MSISTCLVWTVLTNAVWLNQFIIIMTQWKVVILTLADDQVCGYCVPDVGSCPTDDVWPVIFCHGIPWNNSCHRKYIIQCKAVIQNQSTPYPWTSCITQLPFLYKVTTSHTPTTTTKNKQTKKNPTYTDIVFCSVCWTYTLTALRIHYAVIRFV